MDCCVDQRVGSSGSGDVGTVRMKVIEVEGHSSSSTPSSTSLLVEACHNVLPSSDNTPPPSPPPPPQQHPSTTTTTTTSSSPPPSPSSPPPSSEVSLARRLHGAFIMHSAKAYLPSSRLYAGMASPAAATAAAAAAMPPVSATSLPLLPRGVKPGQPSPGFRDSGGGNGEGGCSMPAKMMYSSGQPHPAKLQRAASLVYAARMQQEGFPYGLSGVPTLPSYNYGSELYSYATNGFPRKSRICSYCSKVFTRSTTRRYHEKRCPLLRAAGSLMKGSRGTSMRSSPSVNGYSYGGGGGATTEAGAEAVSSHQPPPPPPPPPPPLTVMTESSPSASTSTSVNTSPASEPASGSLGRAQPVSAASFYGMYGSRFVHTAVSTTSPVLGDSAQQPPPPPAAASVGRQSILDHNQNSILSIVKQEPEAEDSGTGEVVGNASKDSSYLLRNKMMSSQVEDQGQAHLMFSPLSATSGSRSDEEEMDSDDGEASMVKASVHKAAEDGETDLQKLRMRQYRLAQLAAFQASHGQLQATQSILQVSQGSFQVSHSGNDSSNTTSLSLPGLPNTASSSEKLGEGTDSSLLTTVKEEGTLQAQDFQEEENTQDYIYPQITADDEDTEEQDDEEMEEEEDKTLKKKCGICSEEFEQVDELRVHERVHQKYKPNSCRFCGQRFIKISMRIAHQRLHTGRYSLGCVVCGLHVLTKYGLRQHVHREHYRPSAGDTTCRYCSLTIDSVYDLRLHFISHRRQVPQSERESIRYLPNPLPALTLSPIEEDASQELPTPSNDSKTSRDSPLMPVESNPPPLIRPVMPISSAMLEESAMRRNGGLEMGRSREKEWCRICEKEIPKSAMRYHEREHADQKPYECSLCKKRFGYKNNMKSHMKLHAGIKPYQCQVCGAKFTRGSTLRRHARRHGVNNDTIWDFFVRKTAASRTALLTQGADPALAAMSKGQGHTSPPSVARRAMKVDPALMASLGKCDTATAPEKPCPAPGYSSASSLPQTLFTAYPNVPAATQAMLQPYITTQQYLGYAAGFPSAAAPPPPPPQPQQAMEADVALDFSMPDKQRRRSSSSSSASAQRSPSTASLCQGATYQMSAAMERSPVGSQGQGSAYWSRPLSAAGDGGRRSFSSYEDDKESQEEEMRQRSVSFNGSYQRYHHHKFNRAGRYSLGEARVGESRPGESRFGETRIGDARLGETRFIDNRLGETRLGERHGDARLGENKYGDIRLGENKYGDARLGERHGDARLGERHGDARLGENKYGDARLGERHGDARLGENKYGDARLGESRHGDSRLGERHVDTGLRENKYGDSRHADTRLQDARIGETMGHYRTDPNTRPHPTFSQSSNPTQNVGTQDSLCCHKSPAHGPESVHQKFHGFNALDMSVNAKPSPGKMGLGSEGIQHETLAGLMSSGRLYHCRPCDCFYTDLTMFRLHQKIHLPDQPYVCFLCRQDCQDKIGFSRHMLAHLR